MGKNIALAVLATALFASLLGVGFLLNQSRPLGASSGPDHYNQENFFNGLLLNAANSTGTTALNTLGCATSTTATTTLGILGATTSTATSSITLPGALLGDLCFGSLDSVTSTFLRVSCDVFASNTVSLKVSNTDGAATRVSNAGVGKVCFLR